MTCKGFFSMHDHSVIWQDFQLFSSNVSKFWFKQGYSCIVQNLWICYLRIAFQVLQKLSPSRKTTFQITEIQFVFNHVDPSILHNYSYLRHWNRHFCVWSTHFHDLLSTFAPPRSYGKEFGAVAVFAMWRFCQSKIYSITLDHIWWVGNWVVNGNTST